MRTIIALSALAPVLVACGTDEDGQGAVTETVTATAEPAPTTDATTSAGTAPDPAATPPPTAAPPSAAPGEERSYTVLDAGRVTIARGDGALSLLDVSPAAGWTHFVDEDQPDEIEVSFRRGGRDVEFEAELEDGRLEIDIEEDRAPDTGPQTYAVLDAGRVRLVRQGARLRLLDVSPAAGWTHFVDEAGSDEIEVSFRRDGREVEFEAEIDDGELDIEVQEDE